MQFNMQKRAIGKAVLLMPLITVLSVAGCHKQASTGTTQPPQAVEGVQPPPTAAPDDAQAGGGAQATGPLAPGVATRANNTVGDSLAGEVDPYLTGQLQMFIQQQGRLPKSFSEFVNKRLDSVPRPPAGKKWAIDSSTAEVKVVNAP